MSWCGVMAPALGMARVPLRGLQVTMTTANEKLRKRSAGGSLGNPMTARASNDTYQSFPSAGRPSVTALCSERSPCTVSLLGNPGRRISFGGRIP